MKKKNGMYAVFQTPFGNYLYDARINCIEPVSLHLSRLLENGDTGQLEQEEEYIRLSEKGFFKTGNFEIYNESSDFLRIVYSRLLHNMTLQVTQNCNFRCTYCPYTDNNGSNRLHGAKVMSRETAFRAIDFLHQHSIDADQINIGFYGGEPLLEFPLIQAAMEYAKKIFSGKELTFSLTTNATLLTPEILDYFEDNALDLTISLDGPKSVNDVHRVFAHSQKSAFDAVEQKLALIEERYPKLKLRTNIT